MNTRVIAADNGREWPATCRVFPAPQSTTWAIDFTLMGDEIGLQGLDDAGHQLALRQCLVVANRTAWGGLVEHVNFVIDWTVEDLSQRPLPAKPVWVDCHLTGTSAPVTVPPHVPLGQALAWEAAVLCPRDGRTADETRLVYADWCAEHGWTEREARLRAEVRPAVSGMRGTIRIGDSVLQANGWSLNVRPAPGQTPPFREYAGGFKDVGEATIAGTWQPGDVVINEDAWPDDGPTSTDGGQPEP